MEPMKNPGFLPNTGRYLILPKEAAGQTTKVEGSAYSIESAKDPHEKPAEGTIVAKGRECHEFEPDDVVLFGKYSGYEQHFEGVDYLILSESEILGKRLVTPFDEGSVTPVKTHKGETLHEALLRPRFVDVMPDPEGL